MLYNPTKIILICILLSHTFTVPMFLNRIIKPHFCKIKYVKERHACSKVIFVKFKKKSYDKRTCNKTLKSDFFKKTRSQYAHWHNNIYKRRERMEGIENAEYLVWDNLHQDVEAYEKNRSHIGSIDPETLRLYKSAVAHRFLPK